jgi:spore maturation protein CgeB
MKILILNPNQIHRYNWGHQLFRNEIGRQHDVVFYGEGFPDFNKNWNVKDIISKKYKKTKPDLILTYGWRYSKDFDGLCEIDDIAKAHIIMDYVRPETLQKQDDMHRKNKYNMLFVITTPALELVRKRTPDFPIAMIPFSVDINIYKKIDMIKKDIVLASFTSRSDVYPNRPKIKKAIKELNIKVIEKRIIHNQLINAINKCKITVTANNIFSSLSMRYTETLACGGLLLCDKPMDMECLGFEDKKHLVVYNGIKDFKKKIKYYIDSRHDAERIKIEKTGMDFVRKNHSCEVRVKQMTSYLNEVLGI